MGIQHIASRFDALARRYGSHYRACGFRCRLASFQRQQIVTDFLEISNVKKILDVGCGPGLFSAPFAFKHCLVGLDASMEMLCLARKNLAPVLAEGEHLPIRARIFDVVLSIETIHLLQDPADLIRELSRVAKSGGQVIVSSLNKSSLLHRLLRGRAGYEGLYLHSIPDVYRMLQVAGLVPSETRFLGFPLPCTWLGRHGDMRSPMASSWIIRSWKI